jgi:hypothetical protein
VARGNRRQQAVPSPVLGMCADHARSIERGRPRAERARPDGIAIHSGPGCPEAARRGNAAQELGNSTANADYCRSATIAVPALITALSDREARVREMAAFALGNIHSDPATTVPALVAALGDQDADVRKRAAGALTMNANCEGYTARDLGSIGPSVVSALAAALRDRDDGVREAARRTLVTYGSDAGTALPTLVELLNDRETRIPATNVIAAIGPDAQPAVEALTVMLKDDDIGAQLAAAAALARIGANLSQALPVAARLLSHEQWDVRFEAAVVVGQFGSAAQQAIPRLAISLNDREEDVRRVAIASFRKIVTALWRRAARTRSRCCGLRQPPSRAASITTWPLSAPRWMRP